MDWQSERRSFWERICVAHMASYALPSQPVEMADRLVRAWEERFPERARSLVNSRHDVRFGEAPPFTPTPIDLGMVDIPVADSVSIMHPGGAVEEVPINQEAPDPEAYNRPIGRAIDPVDAILNRFGVK